MIEIYLQNRKHFKLIESFIAEEDDELYHNLIDQYGVTMLLQDTILQGLKYGDVFLNSIILGIDKDLTVKEWIEKNYEKSKSVTLNIYDLKHKYDDDGGVYLSKDLFAQDLMNAGYTVTTSRNEVFIKNRRWGNGKKNRWSIWIWGEEVESH